MQPLAADAREHERRRERALEIASAGRHHIRVAGRDDSDPRYGAIADAFLPDLDTEAARETTLAPRSPRSRGR